MFSGSEAGSCSRFVDFGITQLPPPQPALLPLRLPAHQPATTGRQFSSVTDKNLLYCVPRDLAACPKPLLRGQPVVAGWCVGRLGGSQFSSVTGGGAPHPSPPFCAPASSHRESIQQRRVQAGGFESGRHLPAALLFSMCVYIVPPSFSCFVFFELCFADTITLDPT